MHEYTHNNKFGFIRSFSWYKKHVGLIYTLVKFCRCKINYFSLYRKIEIKCFLWRLPFLIVAHSSLSSDVRFCFGWYPKEDLLSWECHVLLHLRLQSIMYCVFHALPSSIVHFLCIFYYYIWTQNRVPFTFLPFFCNFDSIDYICLFRRLIPCSMDYIHNRCK